MPITGVGAAGVGAAGGHEYVDRGDPATYDFSTADFTRDGTWRDLNLAAIVSDADAVAVHLLLLIKDNAADQSFDVRKDGNINSTNRLMARTTVANQYCYADGFVMLGANRVVEYRIPSGVDEVYLGVRGWLKPAS